MKNEEILSIVLYSANDSVIRIYEGSHIKTLCSLLDKHFKNWEIKLKSYPLRASSNHCLTVKTYDSYYRYVYDE